MKKAFKGIAPFLSLLAFATVSYAQSGDVSGSLGEFLTLGSVILKILLGLATLGFVGVLVWGAVTLGSNRPRGLAMVGGGLTGALLSGLAFAIVSTLTGHSINAS